MTREIHLMKQKKKKHSEILLIKFIAHIFKINDIYIYNPKEFILENLSTRIIS